MKIGEIGEFGLIERITKMIDGNPDRVLRGAGDDAAVVRSGTGKLLLFTCDAQIDGVHFLSDRTSPVQIGRRAAAVNLSDIAAMGGEARYALVSIAMPDNIDVTFVEGIYEGMLFEMNLAGATIIGGNTARLPERLLIDVFLVGEVSENELLTRDGAVSGDLLCVTGKLGASAAGLELISNEQLNLGLNVDNVVMSRYLTPTPRLDASRVLARSGVVSACIDVSDGLLQDAGHLAKSSEVSITIEAGDVPIDSETVEVARTFKKDVETWALTGGEDFELLFTVAPDGKEKLFRDLFDETGLQATVIGFVSDGENGVRLLKEGHEVVGNIVGFDHFQN